MLMCADASGSPIIIFVCIFAASSSSSSSSAAANDFSAAAANDFSAAAANDFSAKLSYEKGGVREPKSLRLIHLTAVTFNPSTKAPISALDFVLYLHLLTNYFSI
jgi:hypothetical protein